MEARSGVWAPHDGGLCSKVGGEQGQQHRNQGLRSCGPRVSVQIEVQVEGDGYVAVASRKASASPMLHLPFARSLGLLSSATAPRMIKTPL
jgi:hypothetical protein